MVLALEIPDSFGNVVLGCLVMPFTTSVYLGGKVMLARKDYDIRYPNLYATPGFHKQADAFNRAQRGHQNMFETLASFTAMSLVGGLKHPTLATLSGLMFSVGSVLFYLGYADLKLDVKMARYKKGGTLKWIGFFLALGTCVSEAGTMNGWW